MGDSARIQACWAMAIVLLEKASGLLRANALASKKKQMQLTFTHMWHTIQFNSFKKWIEFSFVDNHGREHSQVGLAPANSTGLASCFYVGYI